ncbi:hypothetical protein [Streptomyces sp. SCR1-8]|uniref:hypothetical protein n=1 Tax=Streptomyces TaxID=1883 RepID=UPI003FCC70B7
MIPVLSLVPVPRIGGGQPPTRPDHLGADKAYSSRRNRRYLRRRQISHTIREPEINGPIVDAVAAAVVGPPASTRHGIPAGRKLSA